MVEKGRVSDDLGSWAGLFQLSLHLLPQDQQVGVARVALLIPEANRKGKS